MENSHLVVGILGEEFGQSLQWTKYSLNGKEIKSKLSLATDIVKAIEEGADNLKVLIFVPHHLSQVRELSEPLELIERVRDELRTIFRSSLVNDQPLHRYFRDYHGKSLESVIKLVVVESMGKWALEDERVSFTGEPLWIALRMLLHIVEELRGLEGKRTVVMDLTHCHSFYVIPSFIALELAKMICPEANQDMIVWEMVQGRGLRLRYIAGEVSTVKPLRGIEDLSYIFPLARSILMGLDFETELKVPEQLLIKLEKSDLGKKVARHLKLLAAAAYGMRMPLLPLLHYSLTEMMGEELPEIRSSRDLKMDISSLKIEERVVSYKYKISGVEIGSSVEGFLLFLLSIIRDKLSDMGIVPRKEEYMFSITAIKKKVWLRDMSWKWMKRIADVMEEKGMTAQLATICMGFGNLLDVCTDVFGEGICTMGVRYDELIKEIPKDKPLVVPNYYVQKASGDDKVREKLMEEFYNVIKNPEEIKRYLRQLMAYGGLGHILIYLAYRYDDGVSLLYIRDLVEELLDRLI